MDGVNLKGFYVWKLQDRHVPEFGLFTSSHHQSRPKASIAAYREIIERSGFPGNNVTSSCRIIDRRAVCSICARISENKLLLFFAACLLLTLAMLVGVVIVVVRGKRTRRRRRVGLPVCPIPLGRKCQPWERVSLQSVTDRTRVVRR